MPHTAKCDICNVEVVWSEIFGWRHKSKKYPYGTPFNLDQSGHKPKCKNGWKL